MNTRNLHLELFSFLLTVILKDVVKIVQKLGNINTFFYRVRVHKTSETLKVLFSEVMKKIV